MIRKLSHEEFSTFAVTELFSVNKGPEGTGIMGAQMYTYYRTSGDQLIEYDWGNDYGQYTLYSNVKFPEDLSSEDLGFDESYNP